MLDTVVGEWAAGQWESPAHDACVACGAPADGWVRPGDHRAAGCAIEVDLIDTIARLDVSGVLDTASVALLVAEIAALDLIVGPFIIDLSRVDDWDESVRAPLDDAIGDILDAGGMVGLIPPAAAPIRFGCVSSGAVAFTSGRDATESLLVVDADLGLVMERLRQAP